MNQFGKAKLFASLHTKGQPVILYNAWDAASARTIANAGAQAVATSSWAVAGAQGHTDGEDLPLDLALQLITRIAATVEVPVSADFEGGYSEDDGELAANIGRLLDTGAIGINFEDRVVKGQGLYDPARQAQRIAAARQTADDKGVPLFINARTDVFFQHGDVSVAAAGEAIERAKIYADAGASGLFIPGLTTEALIEKVVEGSPLPVNVMVMDGAPSNKRLASLGVARISYGAIPFSNALGALSAEAGKIFA